MGENCSQKEEPVLLSLEGPEGIEIGNPLFLLSPEPCCAMLGLPFWARITGTVANRRPDESLLRVSALLLDADGNIKSGYDDTIALEGGEEGRYDILVKDFFRDAPGYRLVVTEVAEP